jgi:DNA-binding transcriptional LysR family regulator
LDEIFQEEKLHFSNNMELENVEITKPLVAIGLGISIIPYPAVVKDGENKSLYYRRIQGRRIYRELGWVSLKSDYTIRALKQLLGLFEEMKDQLTPSGRAPDHIQ